MEKDIETMMLIYIEEERSQRTVDDKILLQRGLCETAERLEQQGHLTAAYFYDGKNLISRSYLTNISGMKLIHDYFKNRLGLSEPFDNHHEEIQYHRV